MDGATWWTTVHGAAKSQTRLGDFTHAPYCFLVAQTVNNLPAMQETQVHSLGGKIPCRRKSQPAPVFVPGVFHGQKSLAGYSPWGHKELDTIELPSAHCFPFVYKYVLRVISPWTFCSVLASLKYIMASVLIQDLIVLQQNLIVFYIIEGAFRLCTTRHSEGAFQKKAFNIML